MIKLDRKQVEWHLWRVGYLLLDDGRIMFCPNAWTADPKMVSVNHIPPSAAVGSFVRSGGRS